MRAQALSIRCYNTQFIKGIGAGSIQRTSNVLRLNTRLGKAQPQGLLAGGRLAWPPCLHSSPFLLPTLPPNQVWLDNSTVLVGTACNSLLLLQPHRGSHALLQYPRPPTHRLTSDAPANPYHIGHNGQHALAVSPGGHWLVTGGQVSHDILLWQLAQEDHYPLEERQQQGLQLDTPAARRSSAPSR